MTITQRILFLYLACILALFFSGCNNLPDENALDKGWNRDYLPGVTKVLWSHEKLSGNLIVLQTAPHDGSYVAGCWQDKQMIFGIKRFELIPIHSQVRSWGRFLIRHPASHDVFEARKSCFFFDNRIVALGSGIFNDGSGCKTVTTLFQNKLKPEDQETFICSDPQAINIFPINLTIKDEAVLVDKNGNGYYIPAGNDQLRVIRDGDRNMVEIGEKPINAAELAYFDHGADPDGNGYEYCVIPGADTRKMVDFAEAQKNFQTYYQILQKDRKAHIVYDRASNTTGYVIFEKAENLPGLLYGVDRPCLAMLRKTPDGKLRMSVVAPDLEDSNHGQNFDGLSMYSKRKLTVALRGIWYSADLHSNIKLRWINPLSAHPVTLLETQGRNWIPEIITLKQ